MHAEIKSVLEFISWPISLWPGQRVLNNSWVQELKELQQTYIKTYNVPIVPGSFVMVYFNTQWYLIDGQHRLQLLKELYKEGVDFMGVNVIVETYDCGVNLEMAQSIYSMVNARYYNNGSLDETGVPFDNTQNANKVVEAIQKLYQGQVKANAARAPQFDIGDLLREINASGILTSRSMEEVIKFIVDANSAFGIDLNKKNSAQYGRCTAKFFLPYKEPKCRWLKELAVKYGEKVEVVFNEGIMKGIYIITTTEMAKRNYYKCGKCSGTQSKLLNRYKTALIDPYICHFCPVENYSEVEKKLLEDLSAYRVKNEDDRDTEWIDLELDTIIQALRNVIRNI